MVDPQLSEDDTESGTISDEYGVGWSRPVTDSNLAAACDELADWVLDTAETLPGEVETSEQEKPSRASLVSSCLATEDQTAETGESVSDGFLGYPSSDQGDHRYGIFAELRLEGEQRTLLAGYVAQRTF
ncbi:MAG: hypothetical protein EON52_05395 [Actinomycetales bacterium]|nr:MAG: hypothetical protein EON52_05395 [Actinomycetales bacterium]